MGHCLNVSLQEHQKKLCVYTKKQNRRITQSGITAPEYQYINIYQSEAKRLSCFSDIASSSFVNTGADQETYYHGDASTYEEYLDQLTRQKKPPMPAQPVYYADAGYMSDPSPYYEQPTDVVSCAVSNIFYSLNARKLMREQQ